jgi:hypothetical protein
MKKTFFASTVAILSIILASSVMADWMRVVGTTDTETVDKGEAQLEARLWMMEWADSVGNSMGIDARARYGLNENWDARISTGLFSISPDMGRSESGLNDTWLSSRYKIMDEEADSADVAVTGYIKLPTADEDKAMGSGQTDLRGTVSAAKDLGSIIGIASLGYTIVGESSGVDLDNEIRWGLEAVLPVAESMSLNCFLAGAQTRWDTETLSLGAGGRNTVSENVQIFGSLAIGLSDAAADWQIMAGITLIP